jgi:hypothetical protein
MKSSLGNYQNLGKSKFVNRQPLAESTVPIKVSEKEVKDFV